MFTRLICCLSLILILSSSTIVPAQDDSSIVAFDTVDESTVVMTGLSPTVESGSAILVFGNETTGYSIAEIVVFADGTFAGLLASQDASSVGSIIELFVFDDTTFDLLDSNSALVISGPGGIAEMFEEVFDTLEDAVGCIPPNTVHILETRPTTNPQIIAIGFTQSIRCIANCEIYTVFKNPTTGKFGGAHPSSDQDDE